MLVTVEHAGRKRFGGKGLFVNQFLTVLSPSITTFAVTNKY
jgi:hypothetical protein